MNYLKQNDVDLLDSFNKLCLRYLIIETQFHILSLEKKYRIQEYFLYKSSQRKPLKILKKKYKIWNEYNNKLKKDYMTAFQIYIDECQYFDELIQLENNIFNNR